jgi:hypothetical protein
MRWTFPRGKVMSSSITMLTPGPEAVLNPFYDWESQFLARTINNLNTDPQTRIQGVSLAAQAVRQGMVSYSPIMKADMSSGYDDFIAWHTICRTKMKAGYFLDQRGLWLNDVPIGVGNGAQTEFQIRYAMSLAGETAYQNIYFPIVDWATPLRAFGKDGILVDMQNDFTVKVAAAPVLSSTYDVVNTTGRITFDAAPDIGDVISVSCYYVWGIFPTDAKPEITQSGDLYFVKDYAIQEVPQ